MALIYSSSVMCFSSMAGGLERWLNVLIARFYHAFSPGEGHLKVKAFCMLA
jgi:hypothetical protein